MSMSEYNYFHLRFKDIFDLSLTDKKTTIENLTKLMSDVIQYSVKTSIYMQYIKNKIELKNYLQ